jgi:hypothetical protein
MRTPRKKFRERVLASARDAEKTGAPAGWLSGPLVASRANVLATIFLKGAERRVSLGMNLKN